MSNALKCTLTLAAGVLAFTLPTFAGVVKIYPMAVPEPSSIVLLVGGLAAVIGAVRLRRS
jgi:PEP-CTERM motif